MNKEENKSKKYWLDRFLIQPNDIKLIKVFYKIITWIFTFGLSISVIGIVIGIVYLIINIADNGLVTIWLETIGYSILIGFLSTIIYFFGMLLCNLLDNIQNIRLNSEKTVEFLGKMTKFKEENHEIPEIEKQD